MPRIEGHCEAKKHSYRQVQDGVIISFVVHPNDVSPALAAAPLGTVFMLGYAEVTGEETAAQEAPQKEKRAFHELRPSAQAGILCDDPVFQEWMRQMYGNTPWADGEDCAAATANMLRNELGIASRRQLDTDGAYAEMFQNLYARFRKLSGRETWRP